MKKFKVIFKIFSLFILLLLLNTNIVISQSCYTISAQIDEQPSSTSDGDLFIDGWEWSWNPGTTTNHSQADPDFDYQGSQVSSTLVLETSRDSSDPEVSLWIGLGSIGGEVKSIAAAVDNGSFGSSTRLACLQGGVCVEHGNVIWENPGLVSEGNRAYSRTNFFGRVYKLGNNGSVNITNDESSEITIQHKKENGNLLQYYNTDITNVPANHFPISYSGGWLSDSDANIEWGRTVSTHNNGIGLHYDAADTFNDSGTIKVESRFFPSVRCINSGYSQANADLFMRIRAATTDVSSGGNCP